MIHAIAYILFILPFTAWLGHELKKHYKLLENWPWIAAAFLTGLIGSGVSQIYGGNFGNFLLHASGGVSSVFLFIYLIKTLKLKFNWRLAALLMFGFVSTLGVLNELAEYVFELLDLGILSFDTHDTWRDFVANSTGALVTWGPYCLFARYLSTK